MPISNTLLKELRQENNLSFAVTKEDNRGSVYSTGLISSVSY